MARAFDIPYLDRDVPDEAPLPPCHETNGDLVGLGFRLGLYMLAVAYVIVYARHAKAAAAGESQVTMISYFAVFVTLYAHGMHDVTDVEFVTITYLLGLFALVASLDFHLYLAHGTIKTASPQHRLYFVFRFLMVSVTSIFTWGLQLAFWATYFRDMRCGESGTSAFLFAQMPAYGPFRAVALLCVCVLFLYSVLATVYVAYRLLRDFEGFVQGAQTSAKESEEGTYWESLGTTTSRHFSQLLYGVQKVVIVVFMIVGAELTIQWNKVPFVGNVYDFGQILFLLLGMLSLLQSILMPAD